MENDRPDISIIVPIYNADDYLDCCIQSILNQSIKNIEVILVDDGSTDKSKDIEMLYKNKDNRVVVVQQVNGGVSTARNNGIKKSRGDFIGFVDADDTIDENMFELMLSALKSSKSDICVTGYKVVSDLGIKNNPVIFNEIMNKQEILNEYCPLLIGRDGSLTIHGTVCRCLYSRALIKGIRFNENIKLMEDTLFNLEAFMNAESVCFTPDIPYNYYVYPKSATNKYRPDYGKQKQCIEKELRTWTQKLIDNGVCAENNYYATVFDLTLFALKNIKRTDNPEHLVTRMKTVKRICEMKISVEMIKHYTGVRFRERLLVKMIRLRMYALIYLLL